MASNRQSLDDIVRQFIRPPSAQGGGGPAAAPPPQYQPQPEAEPPLISPEEEALLAEAYLDYQPREVPKPYGMLARILMGYGGNPAGIANMNERRRRREDITEQNLVGPREATAARARAKLELLSSRKERSEKEKMLRSEEKREEGKSESDYWRKEGIRMRVENADVMPIADLKRAIITEGRRRDELAESREAEQAQLAQNRDVRAEQRMDQAVKDERDIEAERVRTEQRKAKREVQRSITGTARAIIGTTPEGALLIATGDPNQPRVTMTVDEIMADLEDAIPLDLGDDDRAALMKFGRDTIVQAFSRLRSGELQAAPRPRGAERPR
jgi:hypothetical protein